jgi:uncharacterized damage-inducible protein DinB
MSQGSASSAAALAHGIGTEFRRRLLAEQEPRLRRCLALLGDDGVWRRPGRHGNSAGNLVLHVCGNTTQWILATFGGVPDERDRAAEFAASGGLTATQLADRLADVYQRACTLVDRVTVDELLRERLVQGRYRETGLSAILHVLEHTAGHAYQIYAWTKQVAGVDLRFYDL